MARVQEGDGLRAPAGAVDGRLVGRVGAVVAGADALRLRTMKRAVEILERRRPPSCCRRGGHGDRVPASLASDAERRSLLRLRCRFAAPTALTGATLPPCPSAPSVS
ncbi:hypothetical protein ZWY2020_045112 [Hordeum vulgare]|nr:hypothetical protein ZWY2020_045112 [Hordeum vulgare]